MKRTINIILTLAAFAIAAPSYAAYRCAAPDNEIRRSVVKVNADTGNVASGVVVSENYVLTAAHVVIDSDKINVMVDGMPRQAYVLMFDQPNDLALLKVATRGIRPLPLSRSVPKQQDQVWAVGYPDGGAQVSMPGVYEGMFDGGLRSTADVKSGQSGGALISCQRGRLVVSGVIRGYGAYKTATGVESIAGFSVSVAPNDIWGLFERYRRSKRR